MENPFLSMHFSTMTELMDWPLLSLPQVLRKANHESTSSDIHLYADPMTALNEFLILF
jgi:hypothetical protein